MTERKMRRRIGKIPSDKGWRSDTSAATYQDCATRLSTYGVPTEVIVDVLDDAYWAALANTEQPQ